MEKFDLHIHSDMSDGTYPPEELPALALEQGTRHIALTDHDTAAGCARAAAAGEALGVKVLAGMEIDAEYTCELHILGLGINTGCEKILDYQRWRSAGRADRNREILKKLKALGMDVQSLIEHSKGNDTRLHIAKAIVAGGYARDIGDAFARYLKNGGPAYVPGTRISRFEAVDLVLEAGGLPVLAHPCKLRCDPQKLISELKDRGLWGIEAFYPASTEGQRGLYLSLAARYGLVPTCGSDFHGKNRDSRIGCAFEPVTALEEAYRRLFEQRHCFFGSI